MKRPDFRYINLPGGTDDRPYSNAVLAGDTLYLSGKLGIDPDTDALPDNVQQEIRIILDSMKQRLEMVGMTMNDLVSVQVFCSDVSCSMSSTPFIEPISTITFPPEPS